MVRGDTITGSQVLGKALILEGIGTIFTLAGDHVLPAMDAMSDMGMRFIDTRHEQAAVHMADAWGRITGQPGVAMYTTPGFANAIPGLSNALSTQSPLLSISGSAPLSELGRGAGQEIDQIGMAQPTTKGAWMVNDARRLPQMVAEALRIAYIGRRGPVHLTVPLDVQQQEVLADEVRFYDPKSYRNLDLNPSSDDSISEAVALLKTAEKPLIIAGSAAGYSNCGDALKNFIETTRIPLMTEGDARGIVSDKHPYCCGFFDTGLNWATKLLKHADVIVLLGRSQDVIVGYALPPVVSNDVKIIQIDPAPALIGRNKGVSVGVVGDIEIVLDQLNKEVRKYKWKGSGWIGQLQNERQAQNESLVLLGNADTPMHAMTLYKNVQDILRDDDILVFDGGDFCHFGKAFLPATNPKTWWYLPPLGMLGIGMPTAIALKLAYPEKRVIHFTGDGAFGFNAMEFDTAVRHNLPILVVMGNDGSWGIDRHIQLGVFGKTVATDLLRSRYEQLVIGLGGHGDYVDKLEHLSASLDRAFKAKLPALLNVQIKGAVSPRGQHAIERWKNTKAPSL